MAYGRPNKPVQQAHVNCTSTGLRLCGACSHSFSGFPSASTLLRGELPAKRERYRLGLQPNLYASTGQKWTTANLQPHSEGPPKDSRRILLVDKTAGGTSGCTLHIEGKRQFMDSDWWVLSGTRKKIRFGRWVTKKYVDAPPRMYVHIMWRSSCPI